MKEEKPYQENNLMKLKTMLLMLYLSVKDQNLNLKEFKEF